MIQKFGLLGAMIGVLLALGLAPLPLLQQAETSSQVIAAVNAFRTANGLPALEVDYALMGAAQAHSDYQAATGQVTHTGQGGSNPLDRAYAWGFGNGARAFVSENIAGGYKVTIDTAIYNFWQDSAHLHTMLNPNAIYIGAGVATSGKSNYYTVVTGYYSGAKPKATAASGATAIPGATSPPQTTAVAYDPFILSTPREDGAIIHVVGYGQTLIGIANTYGVLLADILRYNGYSENEVIYPKEWVIIRPAGETSITESTPTPELALAPTKATATPRPTRTPQVGVESTRPVVIMNVTPTNTPVLVTVDEGQQPLVVGAVILSLGVLVGVIFYGLLHRK